LADFLRASKERKDVVATHRPAEPNKPSNGVFSWARRNDTYVVRGPKGYEGQTVTVTRKDGTTKSVKLGVAIEKTSGDWFYRV
jgi:hypothetical protein